MNVERVVNEITPPVLRKISTPEGFAKASSMVQLKLYGLYKGKAVQKLFYDSLVETIKSNPEIEAIFPEEDFKNHYVYCEVRNTLEHPDLFINRIRYYRMYQFFQKHYPDVFESSTTILDVGDTSGFLIKAVNKEGGVCLNINQENVDYINSTGVKAVQGDAERLQYDDNSFDYCFCFQCLEHLPNPLAALNELGRVARKKVFISIPYAPETKIYNVDYWVEQRKKSWHQDSVKDVDCHIFEFSTKDLKKLLTYINMEYEKSFLLYYFDETNHRYRLLNQRYQSYFNFFVLNPFQRNKRY